MSYLKNVLTKFGLSGEVLQFLWERKIWLLIPLVGVFLLVGLIFVFIYDSTTIPFIYMEF